MKNEDFDIKIFSPVAGDKTEEPVVLADEMKRQVVSGNLEKARNLGKTIADSFPEAAEKEELWCMARCCNVELNRAIKDQAIILSVFTAEYCINRCMPHVLSTTAVSSLYATLVADSPKLYNELLASAAFSFYYMNLNENEVSPEDIGKTFAMLCGNAEDDTLRCYGRSVFETSLATYKKAADDVDFA